MPNKKYQKGYRFEREVVNYLKKDPACVFAARTAGSHSPFDIVAITGNKLLLIQCKAGKAGIGVLKEAEKKMPDVPVELNVSCLTAYKKNGQLVLYCIAS